jgi:hypothetical protein
MQGGVPDWQIRKTDCADASDALTHVFHLFFPAEKQFIEFFSEKNLMGLVRQSVRASEREPAAGRSGAGNGLHERNPRCGPTAGDRMLRAPAATSAATPAATPA